MVSLVIWDTIESAQYDVIVMAYNGTVHFV